MFKVEHSTPIAIKFPQKKTALTRLHPSKKIVLITNGRGHRLLDGDCTLECHNGGTHDKECESCTSCDAGFDPKLACKECKGKCLHGTQNPATCVCTCAEGWSGGLCDENICTVSSNGAIQVRTDDYVSVKTHTKFLIHDNAVFTGTHQPTHQHSDYVVLKGGAIKCDDALRLGDFGRLWVRFVLFCLLFYPPAAKYPAALPRSC